MKKAFELKLEKIACDWSQGHKNEAAQAIKKLNKLQLFYLTSRYSTFEHPFCAFIESVLTNDF